MTKTTNERTNGMGMGGRAGFDITAGDQKEKGIGGEKDGHRWEGEESFLVGYWAILCKY